MSLDRLDDSSHSTLAAPCPEPRVRNRVILIPLPFTCAGVEALKPKLKGYIPFELQNFQSSPNRRVGQDNIQPDV